MDIIEELDFEKGKVMVCAHCGNEVLMPLIRQCEDRVEDLEGVIIVINKWTLYFCTTCREVTLEKSIYEDFEYPPEGVSEIVYPPIVNVDRAVPNKIVETFISAKNVQNKSNHACILLLRSTLERIAKDQGATNGNLYDKMKKMSDDGIIPSTLNKMAKILRVVGNAVAHGDDETEFSDYTVKTLIEFAETIIDYVYVLPNKISIIGNRLSSVNDVID